MSFNIDAFKSRGLAFGGARPSLFEVRFTFPPAVGVSPLVADKGRFLVKAAALPASTVGEIDVSYFGRKIKLTGDRTFDDWTATILNDEDFLIRNAFETWSNYLNTHQSNRVGSPDSRPETYKAEIEVVQYSKGGPSGPEGIIRGYRLVGAFPTQVSAITLDWDRNNTIEEFDVRFAYDYWVPMSEINQYPSSGPLYSTELNPK